MGLGINLFAQDFLGTGNRQSGYLLTQCFLGTLRSKRCLCFSSFTRCFASNSTY